MTYIFGVDSQLIADGTYFVVLEGNQLIGYGGWSNRKTLYGERVAAEMPDDESLPIAHMVNSFAQG